MSEQQIKVGGIFLRGYKKINVLLGKNGSGKNTFLRNFLTDNKEDYIITYIPPERAGILRDDVNVQIQMKGENWLENTRRYNQVQQFKEQSYVTLLNLLNAARKQFQDRVQSKMSNSPDDPIKSLQSINNSNYYVEQINRLLDGSLILKETDLGEIIIAEGKRKFSEISSGEAEVIALAIECLWFFMQANPTKKLRAGTNKLDRRLRIKSVIQ